jgi:hypothetical protein
VRDKAINTQETGFVSQETEINTQETGSNTQEIFFKNAFLEKISPVMKSVSWEIFFISSMFSEAIYTSVSKSYMIMI